MNNLLGIYEKAFPKDISWEDKFNKAKEAGFDFIELSIDKDRLNKLDYSDADIEELLSLCKKYNMPFRTLVLSAIRYFPLGDKEYRNKGIEIIKKAIILAKKLKIEIIQLCPYDVYQKESNDETKRLFKEAILEILDFNQDYNIILALEVMEDIEHFNRSRKIIEFLEEINNPLLKEYGDTGNIIYNGFFPLRDIKAGVKEMVAIHIKDGIYHNEHNIEYGKGEVDFKGIFNHLKVVNYQGYLVSECWYEEDYHPDLKYINDFIRGYMR